MLAVRPACRNTAVLNLPMIPERKVSKQTPVKREAAGKGVVCMCSDIIGEHWRQRFLHERHVGVLTPRVIFHL